MEKQTLLEQLQRPLSIQRENEVVETLRQIFHAEHPEVLDDEMEDKFNYWLTQQ